jgi:hypothetical protein
MFTPEERRIFGPYANAQGQQVYADPVAAYRRLLLYTEGELGTLLDGYQQGELGQARSADMLAQATIKAFELEPFDKATGKGTLQDDALALLSQFLEWRDQKKTPVVNSPTSAPPMEQDGWQEEELRRMKKTEAANLEWQQEQRKVLGRRPLATRTTTPLG